MRASQRRMLWVLAVLVLAAGAALGAAVAVDDDPGEDAGGPAIGSTITTAPTTTAPTTSTTRGPLGSGAGRHDRVRRRHELRGRARAPASMPIPATAVGPFAEVLRGADLAIGNLETAHRRRRHPRRQALHVPGAAARRSTRCGRPASTRSAWPTTTASTTGRTGWPRPSPVKRAQPDGFLIGVGADDAEAFAPFRAEVTGQRIAVIAATQVLDDEPDRGVDGHRRPRAGWPRPSGSTGSSQEVQAARATSDTVVVFLHWGIEQDDVPDRRRSRRWPGRWWRPAPTSSSAATPTACRAAAAWATPSCLRPRATSCSRRTAPRARAPASSRSRSPAAASTATAGCRAASPGACRSRSTAQRPSAEVAYWEGLRTCADLALSRRQSIGSRKASVVPPRAWGGMPSLRWSQVRMRSALTFTATRLFSMNSTRGLTSSEYGPL